MERRSTIFASFPENTFLENIAIDPAGLIYVTSLEEGIGYRFDQSGNRSVFASINGKLAGIVCLSDGSFLLNGWSEAQIPTIYRLYANGKVKMADQPAGASFLNGMALLNNRMVLICDAYAGCLWSFDTVENITSKWLEHPLFTKIDMAQFFMPGANGIKFFNKAVYVFNTERRLLLRISVIDDRPLTPEVIISDINLDDFAFDEQGNLYAATHIFNSVVKITPILEITVIGDEPDGLAGSTAVAFGRTGLDKHYIYVTTNGGISLPVDGKVQNGRIVKLKVN